MQYENRYAPNESRNEFKRIPSPRPRLLKSTNEPKSPRASTT